MSRSLYASSTVAQLSPIVKVNMLQLLHLHLSIWQDALIQNNLQSIQALYQYCTFYQNVCFLVIETITFYTANTMITTEPTCNNGNLHYI